MRKLFDRLQNEGEAAIDALAANRFQEGLEIDFKLKADPRRPTLADNDKRALGEALSGFSNSMGGTLVFGVDCRPGPDGVDCVQGSEPIAEIDRFGSLIHDLISQYITPINESVFVATIASNRVHGSGYLAIHIEKSERRPHRSEAVGHGKYFRRSGKSFLAMEHYEIADMILAPQSASLVMYYEIVPNHHGFDHKYYEYYIYFGLANEAGVSARYPYILIDGIGAARPENISTTAEIDVTDGVVTFSGLGDYVIHPGMRRRIGRVCVMLTGEGRWMFFDGIAKEKWRMELKCGFGCENAKSKHSIIVIEADDLLSKRSP